VELSIVLIIIGLIVGGVLGGQSLIKSAELQRVVNEHNQYATAFNAFRLEYSAIPGDMDNAFDYWGADCGGGTKASCNGDGDGVIVFDQSNLNSSANDEEILSWNHLSLAGIVPGNYTGVRDSEWEYGRNPGKTSGASALSNATYWYYRPYYFDTTGLNANLVKAVNGNDTVYLHLRAACPKSGCGSNGPGVMNAKNMKAVDTKIDDGEPGTGLFYAGGVGKTMQPDACVKLKDGEKIDADFAIGSAWHPESNKTKYNLASSSLKCYSYYGVNN
jgi:hypothetical protein